jgi:aspartate beta-hydroxylase
VPDLSAASTEAEIDAALAVNPQDLCALILRGDRFAAAGDDRAACSFYTMVVKLASSRRVPPELIGDLNRVNSRRLAYAVEREALLRERFPADAEGLDRFSQSLDLLFGRSQLYLQEPRFYYFPGLPQIQFFDRAQFPWLDKLEAATADIRAELIEVLREDGAFTPYVEADPTRPATDTQGMMGNPDWSAFYLWRDGAPDPVGAARCPRTLKALEGAPLAMTPGRTPSVLFSLLKPGAHIPAHHGFINTRLICHLPVITPPGCRLRVGSETREWVDGKAWVFDDTIEHEAWNTSDQTRVVLLFDIWRPELSEMERESVSALFQTIDAYGAGGGSWSA